MIELLYIAIPIAIVVVIAVISSMREHRPSNVVADVERFQRAAHALERRRHTSSLEERGSPGAPE
jgi:heme/copper-type cytochrome/quinol oxidase subunit 2